VNYRLAAPPWVSVGRIHVYVNGRMVQRILVDPNRSLADTALPPHGPVSGQLTLTLPRDSWIVLEAVGDRPMFPVVTGPRSRFCSSRMRWVRWPDRSASLRPPTSARWWWATSSPTR
jgi:hypothetical protein